MQTISTIDSIETRQKFEKLVEWFSQFESCIVAFSAGVDSSLLAFAAKKALGARSYAVTSHSVSFAESEIETTHQIANEIGIELISVSQNDLARKEYVRNGVDRCYFCRNNLTEAILPVSERLRVQVCVEGTQLNDMQSPRPGVKALREAGFRAPYVELGFGKEEIRAMAKHVGLSNWDRPSEACLSSRIAYGQAIDSATLIKVEKAEIAVRRITGAKIVRVRTIGLKAIVELDKEHVSKGLSTRPEIESGLRALGYGEVEIDREGYVSGKMLSLFIQDS